MTNRRAMPNVISKTEDRLQRAEEGSTVSGLANLVQRAGHSVRHDAAAGLGYHPQIQASSDSEEKNTRTKKRKQTAPRTQVVNMRLSDIERDRFYSFCEERNLSLPDGLMYLLNAYLNTSAED